MGDAGLESRLGIPRLFLHRVGAPVKRQDEDIHRKGQKDDREPRRQDEVVRVVEDDLEEKFQRTYKEGLDERPETHFDSSFPSISSILDSR